QKGGSADDGKTQSIALNDSSSGAGGRGGYRIRRIRNGGRRIIPLGRLSDEEIKEIQKRNPQSGSRISMQELGEPRVKKIPLKINNDNKSKKDEEKEMSLGIGGFLRYLLIAAIIVAILVFVGRQAFQMSKSFND
nr:hypothetical protein [Pseudobdellovibrionaceae bacterium]